MILRFGPIRGKKASNWKIQAFRLKVFAELLLSPLQLCQTFTKNAFQIDKNKSF